MRSTPKKRAECARWHCVLFDYSDEEQCVAKRARRPSAQAPDSITTQFEPDNDLAAIPEREDSIAQALVCVDGRV